MRRSFLFAAPLAAAALLAFAAGPVQARPTAGDDEPTVRIVMPSVNGDEGSEAMLETIPTPPSAAEVAQAAARPARVASLSRSLRPADRNNNSWLVGGLTLGAMALGGGAGALIAPGVGPWAGVLVGGGLGLGAVTLWGSPGELAPVASQPGSRAASL